MPGRPFLNTTEKQLAGPTPSDKSATSASSVAQRRSKENEMKSIKTMLAIGFSILLLGSPLCAGQDHKFTMQVPFDFTAGNHQFSAGDYTITSDTATSTVVIRSGDAGPTVALIAYPAGDNKDLARAKLVFNQYRNHFFLSQVWPADASGRGLNKCRQEVEMAKSVSRAGVLTLIASGSRKASR
jgi:hypothetical protein